MKSAVASASWSPTLLRRYSTCPAMKLQRFERLCCRPASSAYTTMSIGRRVGTSSTLSTKAGQDQWYIFTPPCRYIFPPPLTSITGLHHRSCVVLCLMRWWLEGHDVAEGPRRLAKRVPLPLPLGSPTVTMALLNVPKALIQKAAAGVRYAVWSKESGVMGSPCHPEPEGSSMANSAVVR